MKSFVFRLERLLDLRSTAERERAQALGQAMRKEESQRLALDEASERLGSCGDQIAGVLDNVAPAGALTNLRLAIEAAMRQVDSAALSHQAARRFSRSRSTTLRSTRAWLKSSRSCCI
jgi:hypothetical protein